MSSPKQEIVQFYFTDEQLKKLATQWTKEIPEEGRNQIRLISLSGGIRWTKDNPKRLALVFEVSVDHSSLPALCVKLEKTELLGSGFVGLTGSGSTGKYWYTPIEARKAILTNRSLGTKIRRKLEAIKISAEPYQRSGCEGDPSKCLWQFRIEPTIETWDDPLMCENQTTDAATMASTSEDDDKDLPDFLTVRSANVFDEKMDGSIGGESTFNAADAASALYALSSETHFNPANSLSFPFGSQWMSVAEFSKSVSLALPY